jgi:hypothetical protein
MCFVSDATDRPVRAMTDGESVELGGKRVLWFDTPHLPHGWDCGYLGEATTRTLLCGDLLTQPGAEVPVLTPGDVLGPSESMRAHMDYYAHGRDTQKQLERLAAFEPRVLACMHGSAFEGDGRKVLLELGRALAA